MHEDRFEDGEECYVIAHDGVFAEASGGVNNISNSETGEERFKDPGNREPARKWERDFTTRWENSDKCADSLDIRVNRAALIDLDNNALVFEVRLLIDGASDVKNHVCGAGERSVIGTDSSKVGIDDKFLLPVLFGLKGDPANSCDSVGGKEVGIGSEGDDDQYQ